MAVETGQRGAGTTVLRLVSGLLALAVSGVSVPLVLGFFGRFHPALDSFSHFRVYLAVSLLAGGLLLALFRHWRLHGAVAVMLGAGALVVTPGIMPSDLRPAGVLPGGIEHHRLIHLNLRFNNPRPELVFEMVARENPDVLSFVEVSGMWTQQLTALRESYPYQIICQPPSYVGGAAILSRRPIEGEPRCLDRGSVAVADIDFEGEAVQVVALHLGWPWPFEQGLQVDALEPDLAKLAPRVILTGDFNAVRWSWTVRRVVHASGLSLIGSVGPSYLDRRIPAQLRAIAGLPIDHVMARGGIIAMPPVRLAAVGSDHLPVRFDFALLPQERAPSVMQAMLAP